MRIGIDIDDTVAITWETLLPYFLKYFHISQEELNYNQSGYYATALGIEDSELIQFAQEHYETIFSSLPVKPDCTTVLKRLQKKGFKIIFITARGKDMFQDPEKLTKNWLENNKVPYDELIVCAKDKKTICKQKNIDIFIDDNIHNCLHVQELNIPVCLMDSFMNQQEASVRRVLNWLEIEDFILGVTHGANYNE